MPADHSIDTARVIRRDAASTPITKPEGARSSVFDNRPRPAKRTGSSPLDVSTVQIHEARPIPPVQRQPGGGYAGLYERMRPGASVDLTKRQTAAFKSWAARTKTPLIVRKLGPDLFGVWKPTAEQLKAERE